MTKFIKAFGNFIKRGNVLDMAVGILVHALVRREQEGYIRKERFKRGKMKAQLEGKSLGNWLPLGYTTDSERHISRVWENKHTVTLNIAMIVLK